MDQRPVQPDKNTIAFTPSQEQFKKLIDSLSEVVCAIDGEGRFFYVSRSSFRVWGYHPDELVGRTCYELMVDEDRALSITATDLSFTGLHGYDFQNRYHRKDGSIATMVWNGSWDEKDGLMYVTGRDVSAFQDQKKFYEEELSAHHEQLYHILDRITDSFFALDAQDRIIYWNSRAEKMTGRSRQELLGRRIWDSFPHIVGTQYEELYQNLRSTNAPVQLEKLTSDGRWMEINVYPSENGLSVFFRDITEQKIWKAKLEEEKEVYRKQITSAVIQAQEKERAQVGQELHDNVNQVLTTVKLYTELCLSGIEQQEEIMQKSVRLLQASIDEIRNLSKRLSPPSLGNVRLKDSVRELVDAVAATNRFTIHLEAEGLEETAVDTDVHLALYRILQEHFTNVLKHAGASFMNVRLEEKEGQLFVEIQDNGKGFDPSERRKGVGITNMITRAENLGGTLFFESNPMQGCRMKAVLPCVAKLP